MRLPGGYRKVISATIFIGKRLCDAFAWLFYGDERGRLPEHYRQQRQPYFSPGVGGLGKLEFIERNRIVNGHLVLYHDITTFLTLGDVSLINMEDLSLSAVAELKTPRFAEDRLDIHVTTVGRVKEPIIGGSADGGSADGEPVVPSLPQNMEERLDRQIKAIVKSFDTSGLTCGRPWREKATSTNWKRWYTT